MTATSDITAARNAPWWWQLAIDVWTTLATLVRKSRLPEDRRLRWSIGRVAVVALVTFIAIAAAVLFFDNIALMLARELPLWLVQAFNDFSDLGKAGWFAIPTGFLLMAIAGLGLRKIPHMTRMVLAAITVRVGFLFLAIGAPALFSSFLKRLIGRARPSAVIGNETLVLLPFNLRHEYASIPSGHGTTAFAAAIAIGALWPRARVIMWVYAVLIGVSRVVITTHYPSDIIASAFVGIVGALLVRDWFAARRLGFFVDLSGGAHALPGPSLRRVGAVAQKLLSP